jgi:voltage-gated potassium channel
LHVRLAAAVLAVLLTVGVAGYMSIEGMTFTQALYMTVITLSTVGFREVKDLSTAGMYFTMFIIVTGVVTLFYLVAGLAELLLEEVFGERMGRRRMSLRIRKLKGHYVVCGYGRVGENVCRELLATSPEVVVVERDEEAAERARSEGVMVIQGDATEVEVLEEAGVPRARGLVAALQTDADNLFVTLTARSLNPTLYIVTRSVYPQSTDKLLYAGADRVISPYVMSAKRMANLLQKPGVCDFLDLVMHAEDIEYRIEEVELGPRSPYAGKTVGGSRLRADTGVLVLALRESGSRDFNTNPSPDTPLRAGDTLIVMGTSEQVEKMRRRI